MEYLGSHWTDFREILYEGFSVRYMHQLHSVLKSNQNDNTLSCEDLLKFILLRRVLRDKYKENYISLIYEISIRKYVPAVKT